MKKIFVMFLVFALSITMFGCHRENDTPKVNKDQTQLYVFNYDGGVGQEWLESAIEKFEEKYADYEFEPGTGKKGVQVLVTKEKNENWRSDILRTILPSLQE